MADVLMLAIVIAFFSLCVGFVALCQRIIGPAPAEPGVDTGDDALERLEVGS